MMRRSNLVLLGVSTLVGALSLASGAAGCRADETSSGTNGNGGDGGSGSPSSSSAAGNPSSTGVGGGGTTSGTGGEGTGGGGTGGGGTGGGSACNGQDATVYQVNQDPNAAGGPVGNQTAVKLKGVVAMSQKWLVSKSSAGKCLWGVFVSAPDVGAMTKEYSGILVVARGKDAVLDPVSQNTFCPKLGVAGETPGDPIPDDVTPGDVLDVVGLTDYFLLNQCAQEPNGSTVAQRQISNACLVEKTGTATPPEPHVFSTEAEIKQLASPTDKAFHDKWGGAKVRVEGPLTTVPQTVQGKPSVISQYGELILEGSNLVIGDKLYYRGYLKGTNGCYDGPKYTVPMMGSFVMEAVEGFTYLNYCTWSLQANNKCTDLDPASEDCSPNGPLMCK